MIIKPHHFMDIIKLYGAGVEVFVPAPDYGHDFYRIANEMIGNHNVSVTLTTGADDICGPCIHLGGDGAGNGTCQDSISHIKGITSKDQYNKLLDTRIMEELGLCTDALYTAAELCRIMGAKPGLVQAVWREEAEEHEEAAWKRACLFAAGVKKYLCG